MLEDNFRKTDEKLKEKLELQKGLHKFYLSRIMYVTEAKICVSRK